MTRSATPNLIYFFTYTPLQSESASIPQFSLSGPKSTTSSGVAPIRRLFFVCGFPPHREIGFAIEGKANESSDRGYRFEVLGQVANRQREMVNILELKKLSGTPGVIRTPDPLLRRQVLYPAELRAHTMWCGSGRHAPPTHSIVWHGCGTLSILCTIRAVNNPSMSQFAVVKILGSRGVRGGEQALTEFQAFFEGGEVQTLGSFGHGIGNRLCGRLGAWRVPRAR